MSQREKKFLWGTQAIADRYCDGNKRRAEHLINKGVIPSEEVRQARLRRRGNDRSRSHAGDRLRKK
jgi:hypothetical protein